MRSPLQRKAKMDDVAVLDDVVFTFQSKLSRFFTFCLAAKSNEIRVGDHLRADKTTLDIAMNLSRRLPGDGSLRDGPSAYFVFARREKAYQVHQPIRRPDKSLPCRLLNTNLLQECFAVALIQLRDFHLDLSRQSQTFQFTPLQFIFVSRRQRLTRFVVRPIKKSQGRLATEKTEARKNILLVRAELEVSQALLTFQSLHATFQKRFFLRS